MKNISLLIVLILGFTNLWCQHRVDSSHKGSIRFPEGDERHAKFPEGDIRKYIAEHIIYPKDAKLKNIQGTVFVSFVVEKDGTVSGAKILRGVDSSLDKEAIRVISQMPKWSPRERNGQAIHEQFNIPVPFQLQNNKTGK